MTNLEEIVIRLRENDKQIDKLFEERKKIIQNLTAEEYNTVLEKLYLDKECHWGI